MNLSMNPIDFFFHVKSISRPFCSQLDSSQFLSYPIIIIRVSQLRSLPGTIDIASHIGSRHPPRLTLQPARTAFFQNLWKGVVGKTLGRIFIRLFTSVLLTWESLTLVPIIQDRGESLAWWEGRNQFLSIPISQRRTSEGLPYDQRGFLPKCTLGGEPVFGHASFFCFVSGLFTTSTKNGYDLKEKVLR